MNTWTLNVRMLLIAIGQKNVKYLDLCICLKSHRRVLSTFSKSLDLLYTFITSLKAIENSLSPLKSW